MRRVSSRHDDECRNVRLEARNSMVCSSVALYSRARVSYSYIRLECRTPGLPESTGVYEISRSTPLSRCFRGDAFASTLDLFALHFARFSSRKSASAPPTRRDGSRRATHRFPPSRFPPARRGGENLHAFRRGSEARGGGNSGQNPLLSRERCRFAAAAASSVNASPSALASLICISQRALSSFYLAHLSKVNVKGAKGTIIRKIFNTNIGTASFHLLSLTRIARKSSYYSFPSTAL